MSYFNVKCGYNNGLKTGWSSVIQASLQDAINRSEYINKLKKKVKVGSHLKLFIKDGRNKYIDTFEVMQITESVLHCRKDSGIREGISFASIHCNDVEVRGIR